jgi:hypothetical protein
MLQAFLLFFSLAHAAPQPIQVPLNMRTCTKTSECEAVPLRCGCCQYQGVSKMYVTDYLDQNQDPNCVDQPCHCQPLKLVPHCVKQRCELGGLSSRKVAPVKTKTKTKTQKKRKKAKEKKSLPPKKAVLPDGP